MTSKILKINGVPATKKEFEKFFSEDHGRWDLVRFTMKDMNTKAVYPKDALIEEARAIILKQMLLEKKCDRKLLEDFEQAVRDETRRSENEGKDESW